MNTHDSALFCGWCGATLLNLELFDCACYGGDKVLGFDGGGAVNRTLAQLHRSIKFCVI